MGKQPAFWAAVVGLSIISQPLFNLAADSKLGALIPGFRELNSYTTRRNG